MDLFKYFLKEMKKLKIQNDMMVDVEYKLKLYLIFYEKRDQVWIMKYYMLRYSHVGNYGYKRKIKAFCSFAYVYCVFFIQSLGVVFSFLGHLVVAIVIVEEMI